MKTYTSHFVSLAAAKKYFRYYTPRLNHPSRQDVIKIVETKLSDGEIYIGVPHLKAGEKLSIFDHGRDTPSLSQPVKPRIRHENSS